MASKMTRPNWDLILQQTLDDRRLSRAEKRALGEVIAEEQPSPAERAVLRSRAFALARDALDDPRSRPVLDWLEDVVKTIAGAGLDAAKQRTAQSCFTPDDTAAARIVQLIAGAATSIDVCVFTITDDRIADAIAAAHGRGVKVRIITDDDKAYDRGSDVDRLAAAGLPLRMDRTPHHMHHKFAIFDQRLLLTGSYNWTRSAAKHNHENFIVVDDLRLLHPFARTFEALWSEFGE